MDRAAVLAIRGVVLAARLPGGARAEARERLG
jgi:hypothetical protein